MENLLKNLLHPNTWLVFGFFILWLFRNRFSKVKRRIFLSCIVLVFYFTTTPFIPGILNKYIENQYPPIQIEKLDTAQPYHIIILGGGMGYDDRLPATSLLETKMLARLVEGYRIYSQLPNSIMITSGYSEKGVVSQAEVARDAAVILGVKNDRIFIQNSPTNTKEEVLAYIKKFGTDNHLIIATSAIHMPRALYLFKRFGVKTVIAAPADYNFKRNNTYTFKHYLFPKTKYWEDIYDGLYELAGLWKAKLT